MGLAAPIIDLIFDSLDYGLLVFFRNRAISILDGLVRKQESQSQPNRDQQPFGHP